MILPVSVMAKFAGSPYFMNYEPEQIEIFGARVHNLQNIDLKIPRNQLVVITGLSGSGKSSLAFDTLYAEGQRRYMETFSSYARQFLGNMERPDVDKITGLSPVIAIQQKTTHANPRSTVGTVTEIYDFLRLLFARTAEPYSYVTGDKMIRLSDDEMLSIVKEQFDATPVAILAPVVKGRKGHYRELFESLANMGFLKVRIDGEEAPLRKGMKLDRYKTHDIELIIDRLTVREELTDRIKHSIATAQKHGKGSVMILNENTGKTQLLSRHLMCPVSGISYDEPAPNSFSFNSPYGACEHCNGLGMVSEIDLQTVIPDPKKSIKAGGILPLKDLKNALVTEQIIAIGKKYGFTLDTPISDIPEIALNTILYGSDEMFSIHRKFITGNVMNYNTAFEGVASFIANQSEDDKASAGLKKWASGFMKKVECPQCKGARLKKESLYFKLGGKNISELAMMDISELADWFQKLEPQLSGKQKAIATEVLKEINKRMGFLLDVGLEYLTLNRPSASLSGGESQRIRLATQIGSQLVNVLYILDEPSIGLHQRDNIRLINSLKSLRDLGNSVLVVEHDKETILAADHIIDLGPAAGLHGGKVIAQGTPQQFMNQHTLTAKYLSGEMRIEGSRHRKGNGKKISIINAAGHNLKNVDVDFPLGTLICVTGVSGSGKSSLINKTLYPVMSRYFYKSDLKPLPHKTITGLAHIDKVIEVDQSPIGRTPRSNAATYTGVFTDIRSLFASLKESKIRGFSQGAFSFNVRGGRCETCLGAGVKTIEMNFLPDVYVTCDACRGQRYKRDVLDIRYRGKSINDVLNMTIEHAVRFFENIPSITQKISTIAEVGLGYITLGQPSTTLSGGEAQRVKLAAELTKRDTGNTFYILDEPTTGLHFEDVRILLEVIHKLVDKGNTCVIIEHNMDVIKSADYIIDLGPEGGSKGGHLIFEGALKDFIHHPKSITAEFLRRELEVPA